MKKAFVIAYCQQNLGDDMFVRCLLRRYPQVSFQSMVAKKNCKAFCNEKNMKLPGKLAYFAQRALLKLKIFSVEAMRKGAAKKCDFVVRIGGSIFIENATADVRTPINYHSNEFVVGANFGPYRTQAFLDGRKKLLKGCVDVCFREKYSHDLLSELGNVRYAPDVLFGYPSFPKKQKGNGVGISVIAMEGRGQLAHSADEYYKIIAQSCDALLEKGLPVTLLAFCEKEGDAKAAERILLDVSSKEKVGVRLYDGDIDSFLDAMNDCEFIIATRFHAMVLGWAMGKNVLPVIYSNKQTHVIEDVGYDGYTWNYLEGELPSAQSLVAHCLETRNTLDTELLAKSAQSQFSALDRFLK